MEKSQQNPNTPSQPNNIWTISKESQIQHIIDNNLNKLLIVYFTYENHDLKSFIKHNLAVIYNECSFYLAFVDRPNEQKYNFIANNGKFINNLRGKSLPFVFYFYNGQCILTIDNANNESMVKTLNKLRIMIADIKANPEKFVRQDEPLDPANLSTPAIPAIQANLIPTVNKDILENRIDSILEKQKLLLEQQTELEELQKLEKQLELNLMQEKNNNI
jgi:hypothetical protein